jgi:outer membrane protein assembly factor BamB
VVASPAVAYGVVYVGSEDGKLYAFDAATGAPRWSVATRGPVGSPAVANGVVYAGKNNGDVAAWPADGCGQFICNDIWHFATDDPIVTSSPTVVNGTVYIGGSNGLAQPNIAGRLYVFGLP